MSHNEISKTSHEELPVSDKAENDGEKGKNEKQKPRETAQREVYPADNGVFNLRAERVDFRLKPEWFAKTAEGERRLYLNIHLLKMVGADALAKKQDATDFIADYYEAVLVEIEKRGLMPPEVGCSPIEEYVEKRKKKRREHIEPQDQNAPTGSAVAPNQDGATPGPNEGPANAMPLGGYA